MPDIGDIKLLFSKGRGIQSLGDCVLEDIGTTATYLNANNTYKKTTRLFDLQKYHKPGIRKYIN